MKKTYITPYIFVENLECETTFLEGSPVRMRIYQKKQMDQDRYNKFDTYDQSEYGEEQL